MKIWKAAGCLKTFEGFTGGSKQRAKYAVSRTDFSDGFDGAHQTPKVTSVDKKIKFIMITNP